MRPALLVSILLLPLLAVPSASADECVAIEGERSGWTRACAGERDEGACSRGGHNGQTGVWWQQQGPVNVLSVAFIGGFRSCYDEYGGGQVHGLQVAGFAWSYYQGAYGTSYCSTPLVGQPCVPPPYQPWGEMLP